MLKYIFLLLLKSLVDVQMGGGGGGGEHSKIIKKKQKKRQIMSSAAWLHSGRVDVCCSSRRFRYSSICEVSGILNQKEIKKNSGLISMFECGWCRTQWQ